ncbi:unnamed protein product [Heligmosomoides polygyrus]|uniref:Ubiquitin fusion degradation protein 1 n=1 Tax=Heligmosomoides polygyrus TaxID=6339 RepID=A0A183FEB7_HELPZ|nr:unnamed protein product [Heligmosomoides polygyrus]
MMNILSGMMGMGGGYGGRYSCQMRAYSAAFTDGDATKVTELNHGGKILLPNSTLDYLIRYNVPYPMLFKVVARLCVLCRQRASATFRNGLVIFVLVCITFWGDSSQFLQLQMMKQLRIEEGAEVRVESVTLPSATYAKLKPQSLEFLNISNPRAVLEVELRKFACLTKNDIIAVMYADQVLEFLVQEVKPSNAVCIIECDLNLDFDAPEGYVEESTSAKPPSNFKVSVPTTPGSHFAAFCGTGQRLDGKKKPSSNSLCASEADELVDVLQALPPVVCIEDYKPGKRPNLHDRLSMNIGIVNCCCTY